MVKELKIYFDNEDNIIVDYKNVLSLKIEYFNTVRKVNNAKPMGEK